jgi:hypothetical protein
MDLEAIAAMQHHITCGCPTTPARPPLTSQRLKEDEDRAKYQSKAVEYGTDGVCGSLRVGNQIEECEAHYQEDDEALDPRHVGLLILPVVTTDYSNTLLRV